jgi:hypothetical protein
MMSKVLSCLLFILSLIIGCLFGFGNANASEPNPVIEIWTAQDLYNIRNNLSGNYV